MRNTLACISGIRLGHEMAGVVHFRHFPFIDMTEQQNHIPINNNGKPPTLWGWPTFASIGIAITILIFASTMVDLKEIWRIAANCDKRFVLLGALAHYCTYLLRGVRWQRSLKSSLIDAGGGKFGLLVFFYNFVDNLVPAKLGDLYAAHLARINFGIRRSTALGSIVFLRMIDAWVVLFLAVLASFVLFSAKLPQAVLWSLIGGGLIAIGATSIMLLFLLFKKSTPNWLPQKIAQMIRAFQTAMWPQVRELIPIAMLTAGIWALEILWIFCLTLAFDLMMTPVQVVFLTMIPLLASAFPFTPSGAGVVEITLFSCLRLVGITSPIAGSLTVVNRFLDYWLHIGLGVLLWSVRRVIGLRTWRDRPPGDNQTDNFSEIPTDREAVSEN
jgi:uncharacterized protein (TIRG00374 family)